MQALPSFNNVQRISCVTELKLNREEDSEYDTELAAVYSEDGKVLFAVGWNSSILICDVQEHKIVRTFDGHAAEICSLKGFKCKKGVQYLASGDEDGVIILWEMISGSQIKSVDIGYGLLALYYFMNEDEETEYLASATNNDQIQVWNPLTLDKLGTLEGHTEGVHCFSSFLGKDGYICLASGSEDRSIKNLF